MLVSDLIQVSNHHVSDYLTQLCNSRIKEWMCWMQTECDECTQCVEDSECDESGECNMVSVVNMVF